MKTSKIVHDYIKLNDGAVDTKTLFILAAITGNLNFPSPSPSLQIVADTAKAFSDSLSGAKTGDKTKIAIKNQCRNQLNNTLKSLANYVSFIADGNRAILISSGFTVNNLTTSTSKPLGIPGNFTVEYGSKSGSVEVTLDSLQGANMYLCLYGINGVWQHAINSSPSFSLDSLEAGKIYSFQVACSGTNARVVYTDTITKMIV